MPKASVAAVTGQSEPARRRGVREVVDELAGRHGEVEVVRACTALLDGAPPELHADIAVGLSVHGKGIDELREAGYHDHWWPTWGARGLLYLWRPEAAASVVRGLAHDHWRPAEMCLKVSARREVAEAAEGAVVLAAHHLPRVRAVAVRTLGLVGDTEHVGVVRAGLDDPAAQVRRAAALALERMVGRLDLGPEPLP